MKSNRPPDLDLTATIERVREDVTRRRSFLEATPSRPTPAPKVGGTRPRKERYSLNDFLSHQDADFVAHAYRALLRRDPDPAGHGHYLNALRAGRLSKTEILGRIRYSKEGRTKRARVEGLAFPFAVRCIRRTPFLGYVVGVVQYVLRLPILVRNHERLEAVVFQRDAELRTIVNAKIAEIEANAAHEHERVNVAVWGLSDALAAQGRAKGDRSSIDQLAASLADHVEQFMAKTKHLQEESLALSVANHDLRQTVEALAATSTALRQRLEREWQQRADEEIGHTLDGFYASFEDQFRGSREDIKRRVAEHLPTIQAARVGTADAPVLDLGCGRGEWLEVLTENGIVARGLDLNTVMVERSLELGLDVVQSDALEHLRGLPPDSLGAVTGFHLIEHLPFRQVVALLDETRRTLRPGGIALFETPNPENLIVGACHFWYDPTHVKPLPPDMMRFVFEARGFSRVEIVRLHPFPSDMHFALGAVSVTSRLNELLYGWQDYAIVAHKD